MRIAVALRTIARIALLGLLQPTSFLSVRAQSNATSSAPSFIAADVHPNTRRGYHYVHSGELIRSGYSLTDATVVDLIAKAYDVEKENVFGGPSWLELNHYDVVAVTRPNTTPEDLRLMLQALLSDRFHLVVHTGTRPIPAFVLSLGKNPLTLRQSTSGLGNCDYQYDITQHPSAGLSCRNVTMATFADRLQDSARDYLDKPLVESTGLQGTWDFDLRWSRASYDPATTTAHVSIFDAVDKQLGLKLESKPSPLPVVIVDHVDEKPSPNPPGTEQALPLPPKEFEVAVIRPGVPAQLSMRWNPDGVDMQNVPLMFLIMEAWGINQFMIADHPKWIDNTYLDIRAKVAVQPGDRKMQALNYETAAPLMRTLLADRFKLQTHMEDRLADAYVLTAVNPTLKKADPASRSKCWPGPSADTRPQPPGIQFVSCQNITLTEFAEQLSSFSQIRFAIPVLDATNIKGNFDFTLHYGIPFASAPAQSSPGDSSQAPEPSEARTLVEAVREQLGLKLEQQKRPIPMLVIDHIEEKPTDN